MSLRQLYNFWKGQDVLSKVREFAGLDLPTVHPVLNVVSGSAAVVKVLVLVDSRVIIVCETWTAIVKIRGRIISAEMGTY